MSYQILGVNPGHNGSVALVRDGELIYYTEEERLSGVKYDGNPFRGIMEVINTYGQIDEIVTCGTHDLPKMPWNGEDAYTTLVRKYFPKVKTTALGHEHHLMHAATAFYNSGFEKAVVVVVDGAGSFKKEKIDDAGNEIEGFEAESIWICEYPAKFVMVYKAYGQNIGVRVVTPQFDFDNAVNITKAYEAVSHYLGFGFIEAGKTMGLSSYGKHSDEIPNLFIGNRGSKDLFVPHYPAGSFIDVNRFPQFSQKQDPRAWHRDPSKLSDIEKNLAWQIQHDSQQKVAGLIDQAMKMSGINQVAMAGGYGLNCVANYYYKKVLPNIELYSEPISHDGGTAIGAAKFVWHTNDQDTTIRPQTSIYLGKQYPNEELQRVLDDNSDKIALSLMTPKKIAKLIADKNIVAIFQGGAEAGPRALGNRSILYDPRDPDGKDMVNLVKGREWFRPFAGTVLEECADDWFDMAGGTSPWMMYAVNVVVDKVKLIPAVTHVDETCRVQTVNKEQNKHYYGLISEFNKLTGVPVLFNTSFNLAGRPLVETLQDALDTLYASKMKYIWLPELKMLITKTIEDPSACNGQCETCEDCHGTV